MSRPVDPTVRHGRITGASDTLEAVRYSRPLNGAYRGRHRLDSDTPAQFHAADIVRRGGGADVERTDLILWTRPGAARPTPYKRKQTTSWVAG